MSKLDQTDLAILGALQQQETRLSNVAIGEMINVSHSTVARRIAELQEQGYILGYQAVLDRAKLGLGETVLVMVQIKAHGDGVTAEFEAEVLATLPNVVEMIKLSGSWDYVLKVAASSMAHYNQIQTQLGAMRHVKLMRSFPAFTVKTVPLPLSNCDEKPG